MQYRREIDGLRAIAVLPVILFHAGFASFAGGFVGVDVFFVISGYLITSVILDEREKHRFTLIGFYERRARRILPALSVVMAACLPFAWLWMMPSDFKDFSQSLFAVSIFASNVLFWKESGYFDTASELKPLLHTWSLAVEEQYYLIFPLILLLVWRCKSRKLTTVLALIAILSLALAQWGSARQPGAAFYLLPARAWELLIGALLAIHLARQSRSKWTPRPDYRKLADQVGSVLGLFFICYAVFAFDRHTPTPSLYSLLPTIGTALVIVFASPITWAGSLLGSKLLVGLGLISYSAYLWHQPLFAFARLRSLVAPSAELLLALVVCSLFLAYLSWVFVELPFRRKGTFGRAAIFALSLATAIFFGLIGLFGHFANGFLHLSDETTRRLETARGETADNEQCWRQAEQNRTIAGTCRIGVQQKPEHFLVLGDSHAGALVKALHEQSSRLGLSGIDYTYRSCPPIFASKPIRQDDAQVVCGDMKRIFFSSLDGTAIPPVVVVHGRWTILIEKTPYDNGEGGIEHGERAAWTNEFVEALGYYEAFRKDYVDSVNRVLSSGRKVVLVYPVPEMGWNVPRYLAKLRHTEMRASDGSTSHLMFKQRNRATYQVLDSVPDHPNLVRVRPEAHLCDTFAKGRCAAHADGVPLYVDDDHLSSAGASIVVKQIIDVLTKDVAPVVGHLDK